MLKVKAYEIFNNKTSGKNKEFQAEVVESTKINKKNNKLAPAPQGAGMKLFGGYKPKILGGDNTAEELIQYGPDVSRPNSVSSPKSHPAPVPPKPFIIGDKDTPMVLSSLGDNSDDLDDLDSHIYSTVLDSDDLDKSSRSHLGGAVSVDSLDKTDNSKLISSRVVPDTHDFVNNAFDNEDDDYNRVIVHDDPPTPVNRTPEKISSFFTSEDLNVYETVDSNKPYIPEPDYEFDEDEKSIIFSEDEEDSVPSKETKEEARLRRQRADLPMKQYHGEDFSHFLTDDEDDFFLDDDAPSVVSTPAKMMMTQKEVKPATVSQKSSIFKGSKKQSKKENKSNSVRSFSYADSKYATQSKASGQKMNMAELGGDSYESFLRSRHGGDAIPLQDVEDSGIDENSFSGAKKDGKLWKKLTVRLKNKKSKG